MVPHQANIHPAREGAAVNGDNEGEFHLKGVFDEKKDDPSVFSDTSSS
jgi:hypothetical protein